MAKERTFMPQSTAGLIRYFESEGGIKIKPEYVIATGAAFGALVVILKLVAG